MWCVTCKADVAAQVSAETGRVQCAACGAELAQAQAISQRTKDAREILERWSNKSMQDQYGPLPKVRAQLTDLPAPDKTPVPGTAFEQNPNTEQPMERGQETHGREHAPKPVNTATRSIRIDRPTGVGEVTQTAGRQRAQRRAVSRHLDGPHGKELNGPHFQMAPPKQPSWAITTGHWLAYTGVLGLTIGTAVVVGGYFGGYSNYTPTGWLIVTVGQMLLFLGVINLVSGGMEQSSDEVAHRIEVLGERLMRIEATTEAALRGPKIPADRYAEGEVAEQTSNQSQMVMDET